MIFLANTTHILELTTSSTSGLDVYVSYVDILTSGGTPGDNQVTINTATTTNILPAPALSTQRQIKLISVVNKGTIANTITLKKDISGTEYIIYSVTLAPGETFTYTDGQGYKKHSKSGDITGMQNTDKTAPINSQSLSILKVGLANKAAGIWHSQYAANGTPGAWSPGAPGLNGRATDGTTDAGCIRVKNPAVGTNYLTKFLPSSTVGSVQMLMDFLWVNTGLVVTTITAQTITPVNLPARDKTGTINGDDVNFGLLVTTATTNAGAIGNITMSYTNSDGTTGRTATMSSFPATAVLGSLIPFLLQAGDTGVRSVQSVTIGTSLVTGTVSLVGYRIIDQQSVLLANTGGQNTGEVKNIKLYPGVCLQLVTLPTTTTAQTITATLNVEEK